MKRLDLCEAIEADVHLLLAQHVGLLERLLEALEQLAQCRDEHLFGLHQLLDHEQSLGLRGFVGECATSSTSLGIDTDDE